MQYNRTNLMLNDAPQPVKPRANAPKPLLQNADLRADVRLCYALMFFALWPLSCLLAGAGWRRAEGTWAQSHYRNIISLSLVPFPFALVGLPFLGLPMVFIAYIAIGLCLWLWYATRGLSAAQFYEPMP